MNRGNFRKNRITAAAAAALLGMAGPVGAQDTSLRVEELEESVKALTKEIDALKGQVQRLARGGLVQRCKAALRAARTRDSS